MVDPRLGVTVWHHYVRVHGNIASSRCGCMVRSFTTLGESGLSLFLGLRPMKTHWARQKRGRKSPKVRILELGCKRPGEISLNFYVNVRGSKCKPKN